MASSSPRVYRCGSSHQLQLIPPNRQQYLKQIVSPQSSLQQQCRHVVLVTSLTVLRAGKAELASE